MNLTLCSNNTEGLVPYDPYVVSFDVLNPDFEQAAPSLTIRAFDADGRLLVNTGICRPSAQSGASEYQSWGLADPMRISTVGFKIASVSQSSAVAAALNVLYVTLQSSLTLLGNARTADDVSDSSKPPVFVMSGFYGLNMYDFSSTWIQLFDVHNGGHALFCAEDRAGRAIFNASSGEISLVLCPGSRMWAGHNYAFAFRFMNPVIYVPREHIRISLVGGILWRARNMSYPGGKNDPFYIDIGSASMQACMRQTAPYAGINNTLSISFSPNQAMAQQVRMLSIKVLRGAVVPGPTITLYQNDSAMFCVGETPNLATWRDGVLNATLCQDQSLYPLKTYGFSFDIVNPSVSQRSPSLVVAMYNAQGGLILETNLCKPSGQSGATAYERTGLADAMEITEVGFRVSRMAQSSCTLQTVNTLYVTLQTTTALKGNVRTDADISSSSNPPVFVMSGFTGIQMYDLTDSWIQLYDVYYGSYLFCFDGTPSTRGRARWNASTGEVIFTMCSDQTMQTGINYALAFRIMNPLIYRRQPPLRISLVGGVLWKPVNMTYPGTGGGCSDPLFIDIGQPAFRTVCMNQSVPFGGANNTLTVSFTPNQALAEKMKTLSVRRLIGAIVNTSTVELQGPKNDSTAFCVADKASLAAWRDGEMNLTTCDNFDGIVPYETYVISFQVLNAYMDQASPSISIRAFDAGGALLVQTAVCKPSSQSGATEYQRNGHTDPMAITVVGFRVNNMGQSSCAAEAINTLYVTLQTSWRMSGASPARPEISSSPNASVFVMPGFRGLQMHDVEASWIQLYDVWYYNGWYWYNSGGQNLFCVDGVRGRARWNSTSGELAFALCQDQNMQAGTNYAFSFRIRNPLIYRRRPTVSISLVGARLWPSVNMSYAQGCSEPFYIDIGRPAFRSSCMNQTVAYASANNTLTLSLVVNQAMSETVKRFSIRMLPGLNMSKIALRGPNNISQVFCDDRNEPSFATWHNGVMNLTICKDSPGVLPYEPYVISFDVVNPSTDQSSPSLSILAYDENQTVVAQNAICKPSGQTGATEYQRSGMSDPLHITIVGFRVRSMAQSSCTAASLNTLYVTLQSSITLSGRTPPDAEVSGSLNVSFVISGLQSQRLHDMTWSTVQLQDIWYYNGWYWYQGGGVNLFCFNGTRGGARFNATSGELFLTLCPDATMRAGQNYAFSIRIMNPLIWRRPSTMQIAMVDGVLWKKVNISYPGTGICAEPLFIDLGAPAFRTVCMNQSVYFAGANNTLTLSMVPNQALAEVVKRISIERLRGASVEMPGVPLRGPNNSSELFCLLQRSSMATFVNGDMNFTICDSFQGMVPYEPYVISFDIVNPLFDQDAPSLTIRAFDANDKLLMHAAICKPSSQAGATAYDRSGYADVLGITVVGFRYVITSFEGILSFQTPPYLRDKVEIMSTSCLQTSIQ
jgi:hypothetical protein